MWWHDSNRRGWKAALAPLVLGLLLATAAGTARAADCYSIGERVAAQNGGRLLQANAEQRGGQTVCRIVVAIPGSGGERPRRAEFVVPAN